MSLIIELGFLFILWVVSFSYFSYSLLDHRYPTIAASKGLNVFYSFLVVLSITVSRSPEYTSQWSQLLSMFTLGLIVAPTIIPPVKLNKEEYQSLIKFLFDKFRYILGDMLVLKVLSLIIFTIASLLGIPWHFSVLTICSYLLFTKFSAMGVTEAGGIESLTPALMNKYVAKSVVAIFMFIVLWYVGPYNTFHDLELSPDKISSYTGLGIGFMVYFIFI